MELDQYTYKTSYENGVYYCHAEEFVLLLGTGSSLMEALKDCQNKIQKELDSGKYKERPLRERAQWVDERSFLPYEPSDDVSDLCHVDIMKKFTPEQEARWVAHENEAKEHDKKRSALIISRIRELADHLERGSNPRIMALKIPKNPIGQNGIIETWGVCLSHPWGG